MTYKKVQTGANNQSGGLKTGLLRVLYHVLTEEEVKKEPTIPAIRQTNIDITNFKNLIYFILFIIPIKEKNVLSQHSEYRPSQRSIIVSIILPPADM
ncbi:MAG: hypothetical protein NC905_03560 [Candidatus Omnitrophica bacterium]|nr:hypothetical protein [Candidatus Omnitrophota bacterium]